MLFRSILRLETELPSQQWAADKTAVSLIIVPPQMWASPNMLDDKRLTADGNSWACAFLPEMIALHRLKWSKAKDRTVKRAILDSYES